MRKAFSKLKFSSAKSQIFTATSSPSWAHLPSWHIFPFMGTTSPSWAHLPLHGCIYLFMATSSPSWAHLPLRGHIHHGKAFCAEMVIVRLSFWLSFKTGNISGKMMKNELHDITPCKKYRTSDNILVLGIWN